MVETTTDPLIALGPAPEVVLSANEVDLPSGIVDVFRRWLTASDASGSHGEESTAPWHVTLWLTGVDYFSSLGYAPGLAVLAAGYVAPLATVLLVLVTFLAALPVYMMVARHSPNGEGSIAMIERLTVGWGRLGWIGKVLVLTLIGFAMTDFVITITLSAADATHHILENPILGPLVPHDPVLVTTLLIATLCLVFLAGFREAIVVCVAVGVPYMVMSAVIVAAALTDLAQEPAPLVAWWDKIVHLDMADLEASIARMTDEVGPIEWIPGGGAGALVLVGLAVFPKLALGLSGFETGVTVMPHIRAANLEERIRNTQRLLLTAASIMCTLLIGANFVSAVCIPEAAYSPTSEDSASGRALAWLAHELLGNTFGTAYDFATVLILWFAGASAMAGLLSILPRYLPRFGMSPNWLSYRRPIVLLVTGVCLFVNAAFSASVEAQGGAYATGVLVLMSAGAFAVYLAESGQPGRRTAYRLILAVFLYVLVVNVVERPDGIKIAGLFILGTVAGSVWSRWQRASELRVQGITFLDADSERLWGELRGRPDVVLLPVRTPSRDARLACKARSIHHRGELSQHVFLHVELLADTSQFQSPVRVRVQRDVDESGAETFVIHVENAVAVANAIAYVSIELQVREVVIGLLDNGTPLVNALLYLAFGTGEIGYNVRAIFMRLREQWLSEQQAVLRQFDAQRDKWERELLRDLVVLAPAERRTRLDALFENERKRFLDAMPTLPRLPHLILFE